MIRHNAGAKIMAIPGDAVRVTHPAAAAIIPWYLSGGISAANCIGAWQGKGAASLVESYTNLSTPGIKDLTTTSAPTFDTATGWAFNGSSNFLSTNTVIVNNQQWSFICRFSDTVAKASGVMGIAQGGLYALQPKRASGTERGYWAGDFLGFSLAMTSGVMCVAGNKPYKDGLAETGTIGTGIGAIIFPMYLGGWIGSSTTYYQCKIQAAAIYNTPLGAAQVLALSTAMAAL